jgi:hypothetical protein
LIRSGPIGTRSYAGAVKVIFSDIHEGQVASQVVAACVDEIECRLPDPTSMQVVIAGRFESAVKARLAGGGDRPE